MFKVECAPECGYLVRSRDRQEIRGIVAQHAKSAHRKDLPAGNIENMIVQI